MQFEGYIVTNDREEYLVHFLHRSRRETIRAWSLHPGNAIRFKTMKQALAVASNPDFVCRLFDTGDQYAVLVLDD